MSLPDSTDDDGEEDEPISEFRRVARQVMDEKRALFDALDE